MTSFYRKKNLQVSKSDTYVIVDNIVETGDFFLNSDLITVDIFASGEVRIILKY